MRESAETDIGRAKFNWCAFGKDLLVWTIDFLCTCIVIAAAWYFVHYCVFDGQRLVASARDVSKIIGAMAWPTAIVIILLLFRNPLLRILNEIPTFIRRSYYRHGDIGMGYLLAPGADSKKLGDQIGDEEKVDKDSTIPQRVYPRNAADIVGERLVERYGGRYFKEMCIGSRRYVFDVVVETPSKVYGAELKESRQHAVWLQLFQRVQRILTDSSDDVRRRFVFVPVVHDEVTRREVEAIARNFAFETAIEIYDRKE